MPFNVSEFRAQLEGDGARGNLFEVNMPFPVFAAPGNAQRKFTYMCKSAQLPGVTLGVVPMQYFGREIKLAGNVTYAEWTVTVINDEDFIIRNTFERWINGLNSANFNRRNSAARNPSSYGVDALVNQYGKDGSVIKTYKMIGVFPIDNSAIDLDWGNNDNIEEFTVTLAYQWHEDPSNGII